MKCPECVEQGLKSTLQSRGSTATLLGWRGPSYDADGLYHSHDPNKVTTGYECSNGHTFTTKATPRCPNCDYGKEIA